MNRSHEAPAPRLGARDAGVTLSQATHAACAKSQNAKNLTYPRGGFGSQNVAGRRAPSAIRYVWAPPGGTQMTPRCSKRVPEHGTGPSRAFSGGAGRAFEIAGHAAHCSVRRRACGGRHGALGGRARQHRRRPRRRTGPRPPRQSVSLGVKILVEPWCNSAFPRTALHLGAGAS